MGSVPFSSSDLGPELGIAFHVAANLNDGHYGNANSWIGGDDNPFAPIQFAGIALSEPTEIATIALGRDNGNNTTDACGGQCTDRALGQYVLQFTQVDAPASDTLETGDAVTGWQDLATLDYKQDNDDFTSYLRHAFDVTDGNGGVLATGIRVLVPATGLNGGTAIDEIEVYAVPEPSACGMIVCGLIVVVSGRRRQFGPRDK